MPLTEETSGAIKTDSKAKKIMRDFLKDTLEFKTDDALSKLYEQYEAGIWKYLLAYDMGCGNTSIAVVPLNGSIEPWLVNWVVGRGTEKLKEISVKTALGSNGLRYLIGEDAFLSGGVENFKQLPTTSNLGKNIYEERPGEYKTLSEVWKLYFKITIDDALRYTKENAVMMGFDNDISKKNTIFLIAHPAGENWDRELPNYRKLIMGMDEKMLPEEQVITFSEAKASMMYARQKCGAHGRHVLFADKETLIIDIGASTIDVIRVDARGLRIKGSEFSIPVAGRNIDELIGCEVLSEILGSGEYSPQGYKLPDDQFFRNHGRQIGIDRAMFKNSMRMAKEEICRVKHESEQLRLPDGGITLNINRKELHKDGKWLLNLLDTVPIQFKCQNVRFAEFVTGRTDNTTLTLTWNNLLTSVAAYAAQGMESDGQIVITGGSANLINVEECVRVGAKNAGVDEPRLVVLKEKAEYEETVPVGSAWYMMRILNNLDTMLKFPGKLTEDIRGWVSDAVSDCVAQIVQEDAVKKMDKIVDEWVDNGCLVQGPLGIQMNVNSVANLKAGIREYSEKEVGRITADGLAAMKKRGPEPDSRTKEEEIQRKVEQTCIEFLKKIAPTEHTNVKVDFSGLEIAIPGGAINSVTDALKEIDWLGAQGLLGRGLRAIGLRDDGSLLPQKERVRIRNNWKSPENMEEIKTSVKKNVKAAVECQYDNSDGFGIPEAVMSKLREDMEIVLFKQA